MKKATASKRSNAPAPKTPRGKKGAKPTTSPNKATTAEFEREDMGIAPKE